MRRAGFVVKSQDVEDIQVVKTTYGLPLKLASCHTSLAGGYVLEGHIPAEVVERVLRERPKVAGLAVPGMPVGSPGMEQGSRRDPYDIVAFDKQGKTSVYESRR
ncbi:MAG: CopG family transcriptional regulator [Acidobacteria bacterium]|nr:MAG: CopG family transcriptional regulator [Acidobacteriota bacterium]